jgi:transcriptional regulator with PAS, ATPase and Fis domain
VHDQERGLILRALASHKKIGLAAEALGISRSTLYRKLQALSIDYRALFARSRKGSGNEHD